MGNASPAGPHQKEPLTEFAVYARVHKHGLWVKGLRLYSDHAHKDETGRLVLGKRPRHSLIEATNKDNIQA